MQPIQPLVSDTTSDAVPTPVVPGHATIVFNHYTINNTYQTINNYGSPCPPPDSATPRPPQEAQPQAQVVHSAQTPFSFINRAACTEAQIARTEEELREAASYPPRQLIALLHRLVAERRLQEISNKSRFVREFNEHFSAHLSRSTFSKY